MTLMLALDSIFITVDIRGFCTTDDALLHFPCKFVMLQ